MTTEVVADLSGLTRRAIRKVAQARIEGSTLTWHGADIVVRTARSARGGGQAGTRYEFRVDSLPVGVQLEWKRLRAGLKGPLRADDKAAAEREWRATMLAPALAHDRYTPERAAAVRLIAATRQYHPVRGPEMVSERTVQRWIADYEKGGFAKLTRAQRHDAGKVRVFVTARYDKAVPFDDGLKSEIATDLGRELRSLWGNGASLSDVRRLASEWLADVTRRNGFRADPQPD